MTIKITMPTGVGLSPRYGLFGISGYMNEHGTGYTYPHIGGDISQSNQIDMYRYTRVHGKDSLSEIKFKKSLDREINRLYQILTKKIRGQDPAIRVVKNRVEFKSAFDLERFLNDDIWRSVTLNIYEQYPKDHSQMSEQFYVPAFMNGCIPWYFTVEKDYEVYISTPNNTLGGLTRIRYNKGVWEAWKQFQGYKLKTSGLIWEYLYKLYSDSKMKVTSTNDIINFLNHKTFNPMEYEPSKEIAFNNLEYIIMNTIDLKLFELTRQQLDLPDWKFTTKYESIMRHVSDEQVAKAATTFKETWNSTQIRVPSGDLPSVASLYILPITTMSGIDKKKTDKQGFRYGFDQGGWNNEPRVGLVEVLASEKTPFEELADERLNADLEWVRIKTINATPDEQYVTYHRTFGTYHGSSLDKECNFIVNQIAPLESYTIKPETVGMKLEPRHWKIVFDSIGSVLPIASTANSNIHFLFNQKSFYGPKYYLPDLDGFQDPVKDGAYHTVSLRARIAIKANDMVASVKARADRAAERKAVREKEAEEVRAIEEEEKSKEEAKK